ncbi:MAG: anaerobic ribonucleoside-triphosphate reductase activating protein [Alphaproteobacteria bacterium]|nr:anaerobic ribonucleoside-triphosphate reductase activating protein [Alphaproteobacteria bacterium]
MSDIQKLLIGDVQTFSIVDFPCHIAAVAFLQGCPWRCPFCYNKSLQPIKQEEEPVWTFEKFLFFLERRKGVLNGVVFSGGEPLMQKGLLEAVKSVKSLGYHVGLHTGGYKPDALKTVLEHLDWVGFDVKAPKAKYKAITGGFDAFESVEKSLHILVQSDVHFECRTTCDPRFLSLTDLFELGEFLKSMGAKEYYLQKYRPPESDKTTSDMASETLISDENLIRFLSSSFEIFDVRR